MTVPVIVAGVITAAQAAPEVIDAIKRMLDALGVDRSCIIEIVNTTGKRLRLYRSGSSSGTFERAPAPFLEPHQSVVCAARSTVAGSGAVGNIGYAGDAFNLLIDYSNPAVGANDLDASTEGSRGGEFHTLAENDAGNTNAHFRCVLYYTDPDRICTGRRSRPGEPRTSPTGSSGTAISSSTSNRTNTTTTSDSTSSSAAAEPTASRTSWASGR